MKNTSMTHRLQVMLFVALVIASIAVAFYAFGFQLRIVGDPGFHARFDEVALFSTMHVVGGGLCLGLGGFQFSKRLRTKHLDLHRNMGRVYLILVLIGGCGSLVLAPRADGGLVAKLGFGMLAAAWLFSALQAYLAVLRKDIASHRAWMMRNFSLTFAAVTLRIYLGMFAALDVAFDDAYQSVA